MKRMVKAHTEIYLIAGNTLELNRLQRRDEIYPSVNALKTVKIGPSAAKP